jgi:hypothetical protein
MKRRKMGYCPWNNTQVCLATIKEKANLEETSVIKEISDKAMGLLQQCPVI